LPSSVCISVSSRYPSLIILFTRSTTLRSVKRNAGLVACTASSCAWSARISSMAPEGGVACLSAVLNPRVNPPWVAPQPRAPQWKGSLGKLTPALRVELGSKITAAIPIRAAALR